MTLTGELVSLIDGLPQRVQIVAVMCVESTIIKFTTANVNNRGQTPQQLSNDDEGNEAIDCVAKQAPPGLVMPEQVDDFRDKEANEYIRSRHKKNEIVELQDDSNSQENQDG